MILVENYRGLLAVDPGKMNGFAVFDVNGKVIIYSQCVYADFVDTVMDYLDEYDISHLVVEDYKLFGYKAKQQIGSRMEASKIIGKCETIAQMKKLAFSKQPANILPIAQMWTQTKMPGNHAISHQISAYLHGKYWLIEKGISKTYLEEHSGQA